MPALPFRISTALIVALALLLVASIPGFGPGLVGLLAFAWSIPHPIALALVLTAVCAWRMWHHAKGPAR